MGGRILPPGFEIRGGGLITSDRGGGIDYSIREKGGSL